jgi:EGF-like domain
MLLCRAHSYMRTLLLPLPLLLLLSLLLHCATAGNITGKIVATADAARVQRALQKIAQIRNVTVVQEAVSSPLTEAVCGHPARTSTVEFLTEHGDVPTLQYVSGLSIVSPPSPSPVPPPTPGDTSICKRCLLLSYANTSHKNCCCQSIHHAHYLTPQSCTSLLLVTLNTFATAGIMSIVTTVTGTTLEVECGGHGICDDTTGRCRCFPGWQSRYRVTRLFNR